jgi:F-type H+-transporting ATPase subunit delta
MAEIATIARPYAEALFRIAQPGKLTLWADLLIEMAQVAVNPDMAALAHNPVISAPQLGEIFVAVLKLDMKDAAVAKEATNLVAELARNGRFSALPEIAAQFHVLKNAHDGAADVGITSAFELTETQLGDLVASLEKKFGRKLLPTVTVDSSLIGGVRVMVGDEVLDTSVRAKLQQLQVALVA